MTRTILLLFGLLALALFACGGNPAPTTPPAPAETPVEDSAPEAGLETSGTPQLIEFYADW